MIRTTLKTTLITAASLALSGCLFQAHKSGTTDVSLDAFKRISFVCKEPVSDANGKLLDCGPGSDTAETVTEIREHNAVYDALENDANQSD